MKKKNMVRFLLSIKIGSGIMRVNWQDTHRDWIQVFSNFKFVNLLRLSTLKIIWPVIIGYLVVAFCLGLLVYLITLAVVTYIKYEPRSS